MQQQQQQQQHVVVSAGGWFCEQLNGQKCAAGGAAPQTKILSIDLGLCLFIRTSYIMVIHIIACHYLNTTPRAVRLRRHPARSF